MVNTLDKFRSEQNLNQGVPFPTVATYGHHGGFFYYETNNKTNLKLEDSSTLVIESGGHYFGNCQMNERENRLLFVVCLFVACFLYAAYFITDGTSEVVRTFHFGEPTRDMIEYYTKILSGTFAEGILFLNRKSR